VVLMSEDSRQLAANLLKPVRGTAVQKRDAHQAKALKAYQEAQATTPEVEDALRWASAWDEVVKLLSQKIKDIEPREYDPA
jgi:hypothetical protein